ncbi:MAG: hypothetical protein KBA31_21240 [Alphaproteobacteria bacterium]|nr:hypothetical protein [Alphaproteobacteria bacterium]
MHRAFLLLATAALTACTSATPPAPADAFMANLNRLCGQTHEGRLVTTDPADADFAGKKLVMGPVACTADEVAIPFAVGDNRSRTWVITRTGAGVRLKHVHRHDDGSEDKVSRYGGDSTTAGTATRQEFPVDEFSKLMFRANKLERSVTNVWAVEAEPGKHFAYELRRTNRFFRVEFDLKPH